MIFGTSSQIYLFIADKPYFLREDENNLQVA